MSRVDLKAHPEKHPFFIGKCESTGKPHIECLSYRRIELVQGFTREQCIDALVFDAEGHDAPFQKSVVIALVDQARKIGGAK